MYHINGVGHAPPAANEKPDASEPRITTPDGNLRSRQQSPPHSHPQSFYVQAKYLVAISERMSCIQARYTGISSVYVALETSLEELIMLVSDLKTRNRALVHKEAALLMENKSTNARCDSLEEAVATLRGDMGRLFGEKRALEQALEDTRGQQMASNASLKKDMSYLESVLSVEKARLREKEEMASSLEASLQAANVNLGRLEEELQGARRETRKVKDKNFVLKEAMNVLEAASKRIEDQQCSLGDVFRAYRDDKEGRLRDLEIALQDLRTSRDHLSKELARADVRSTNELNELRCELERANVELGASADQLSAAREAQRATEQCNVDLKTDLQKHNDDIEKMLEESHEMHTVFEKEKAAWWQERALMRSEIEGLKEEREEIIIDRRSLQEKVQELESALGDARQVSAELAKSKEALADELRQRVSEQAELQALCDVLKAREEDARAEVTKALKAREEDARAEVTKALEGNNKAASVPPSKRQGVSDTVAKVIQKRRARAQRK